MASEMKEIPQSDRGSRMSLRAEVNAFQNKISEADGVLWPVRLVIIFSVLFAAGLGAIAGGWFGAIGAVGSSFLLMPGLIEFFSSTPPKEIKADLARAELELITAATQATAAEVQALLASPILIGRTKKILKQVQQAR